MIILANGMNCKEFCPQCGQKINNSTHRLVQDSCGHTKCRNCLLQDDLGCQKCKQITSEVQVITPTNVSVIKYEESHKEPKYHQAQRPHSSDEKIVKKTHKPLQIPSHVAVISSNNKYRVENTCYN